jgi:hypothetical protein
MKVSALIVSKEIAEKMCEHKNFVRSEKEIRSGVKQLGFIDGIPLYLDPLLKPGKMLINHTKDEDDEESDYSPFDEDCVLL